MALRSDRHRNRPIAALAFDAGTTIGPRCATIHDGQEATALHSQAGYTTAADSTDQSSLLTRLQNREESIYGLLGCRRDAAGFIIAERSASGDPSGCDDPGAQQHRLLEPIG